MHEQFGEFIMPRAEAGQVAVLASHAAIDAILAAVIGNLHHSTQKHLSSKLGLGGLSRARMERRLNVAF
jgi:hypothetical protein